LGENKDQMVYILASDVKKHRDEMGGDIGMRWEGI